MVKKSQLSKDAAGLHDRLGDAVADDRTRSRDDNEDILSLLVLFHDGLTLVQGYRLDDVQEIQKGFAVKSGKERGLILPEIPAALPILLCCIPMQSHGQVEPYQQGLYFWKRTQNSLCILCRCQGLQGHLPGQILPDARFKEQQ